MDEYKKTFIANMQRLMKKYDLTQSELAQKLDVNKTVVSSWMTGARFPRMNTIQKLAYIFNVEKSDLIENGTSSKTVRGIKIPVLGRVAAGIPIEAIQEIEDYEEIPEAWGNPREYFALVIKGHSMEPRIWDGDRVIVHKQSDVDSGQTAVVIVNGDEATVKRVKKMEGGIMLIALNPAVYQPHFYSAKDVRELPVRIIGLVKEVRGNV